jgi:hypothetical protein
MNSGRRIWICALCGYCLGVAAASSYLLLGGEYFWSIPLWAHICFFPGFVAGVYAAELGLGVGASKVLGVLAVGVTYAALFALAALLCRRASTKLMAP